MNNRLGILFDLLQTKKIANRDVLVLLVCLYFTNWKTGKTRVTTKKISETLDTATSNVRASLRRLKDAKLIAEDTEKDGTSFMIPHPKLFECCSGKLRGLLLKKYYAAAYDQDFQPEDEELEYLTEEIDNLDI